MTDAERRSDLLRVADMVNPEAEILIYGSPLARLMAYEIRQLEAENAALASGTAYAVAMKRIRELEVVVADTNRGLR